MNKGEEIFKKYMEEKGYHLVSQPYIKEFKIRPDFYCLEDQFYYEIISTKQAYSYRKEKMLRAKRLGLNLRIVNPNGTNYIPGRNGSLENRGPEEIMDRIKYYQDHNLTFDEISKVTGFSKQIVNYWLSKIRENK